MNLDLHNVDFHSVFNEAIKQYSGKLAYTEGRIVYGTFQPFAHNLEAEFDATPSTFHLSHAKIFGGAAQIDVSAIANNYSTHPSVQATYNVVADGTQLAKILNNPSVPTGIVRASGTAQYQSVPNQPTLQAVVVHGDLASQQLLVKTSSVKAAVSNIAAHYSFANGNATLHDFRASVLGGEITAQGTMKDISGNSHSEATASIRGVSLAEARNMMGPSASTGNIGLSGQLNADAKASWGKTFDDLDRQGGRHHQRPGQGAAMHPRRPALPLPRLFPSTAPFTPPTPARISNWRWRKAISVLHKPT